jgi:serine/threonine protein phosphatase PrpC
MSSPEVTFGALTDVGRQREHNEDNYLVDKKLGLFVVCDGMGGHAAGEVASALAVRTIHDEVRKEAELLKDKSPSATS